MMLSVVTLATLIIFDGCLSKKKKDVTKNDTFNYINGDLKEMTTCQDKCKNYQSP